MPFPKTPTIQNLEAAFAGESMAHIKYRYFARVCREAGDLASAELFEATAAQEVEHAIGHAELLFSSDSLTPEKCLQYAIDGETYEYTEMYPKFLHEANQEGNAAAAREMSSQIGESREHADLFRSALEKAARRFAALGKVERRHAERYQARKESLGD